MATYSISTGNILTGILNKIGEPTDGTSVYSSQAVDLINRAQIKVLSGGNEFVPELARPWAWAISPTKFILTLPPPIGAYSQYDSAITATVTFESTAGTFSSAPVDEIGNTISVQGWWFQVTGSPEWYKIASHISGQTAFTLDSIYTDLATAGSGVEFLACQLEFLVNPTGGVLRVCGPLVVYRPQDNEGDNEQKIYMSDEATMLKTWPMSIIENKTPTRFCVTTTDVFGNYTIRMNQYPIYRTRVEVPYIPMPTILRATPTPQFYATVTIASPGIFTKYNHGLSTNDPVVLATTGVLPSPLVVGTTYYAVNVTVNTFSLSATSGGSAINTAGTQSGTITVIPAQPLTYPVIPTDHCEILEYMVAYWLALQKNDDRAEQFKQQAALIGKSMIGSYQKERTESSKERGKLIPRLDCYVRGKKYVVQNVSD